MAPAEPVSGAEAAAAASEECARAGASLIAGLAGLVNSFRMARLTDAALPRVAEGAVLG